MIKMKKIAIVLAVCLVLIIGGYVLSSKSTPSTPTSETPTTPTTSAAAPAAPATSTPAPAAPAIKFPANKLTYMVAAPAGGGFDQMGRAMSAEWSTTLGAPVEFGYGDTTTGYQLAMDTLAQGRRGEYNVMQGYMEGLANVIAFQGAPYELDEWVMVGGLYSDANTIMVRKDETRWSTLSELIEYGRTAAEPLTIATTMPLSPTHVNAVVFVEASGIKANLVPFASGAASRNALLGGHVDMACGSEQTTISIADQVKVIGILSETNLIKDLWDCEILGEFNKDFEMPDLRNHDAVWCHKNLVENEPDVYKLICDTYLEALKSDSAMENYKKLNNDRFITPYTPEELTGFYTNYIEAVTKYGDALNESAKQQ